MSTPLHPPQADYLLLVRNAGPDSHAHLSPGERTALAERWNTWVASLLAKDQMRSGHPLALDGRVVSGSHGERITDGPYAEAKEVVGGYVVIKAPNLDTATEIARGCPGLSVGLTVEVRELLSRSPVLAEVRSVSE